MPEIGEIVAGRYRLEEEIGAGSVGWVFRATHLTLSSDVAIKFMRPDVVPQARLRFEREALLAARIKSDHVARVIDHGAHGDLPFMVLDYLEGSDLRQRLREVQSLGLTATAAIVKQVCRGLASAHRIGLVHRDIKPENIFLRRGEDLEEERVVVLDFGVAKVTDTIALALTSPTQTGALVGTPHYLSPEQARGDRDVGPAADLWALAVVAFECLTGQRPFAATSLGPLIAAILSGAIPTPSDLVPGLPRSVDGWFVRAMAREPEHRFGSALEMARAFAEAAGITERTRPVSLAPPPRTSVLELVLWRGEPRERRYALGSSTRIGRSEECEVSIAHHSLSREHAVIEREPGGAITVRDLGSKNGTFVADRRVSAPVRIAPGASVRCGALTFELTARAGQLDTPTLVPEDDAIFTAIERVFFPLSMCLVIRDAEGWRVVRGPAPDLPPWLDDARAEAREDWMTAPVREHGLLVLRCKAPPTQRDVRLLLALADALAISLSE